MGELITVEAFVPSANSFEFIIEDDSLPTELHLPGQGTYEDTLSRLGQRLVGSALSADYLVRTIGSNTLFYYAKPVEPAAVELAPGARWTGIPYDSRLEPLARQTRWWRR